jgi:hypothetical protein
MHSSPKRAQRVAVATPCWPGPGLGDDALLAHAAGEKDLAQHVVDLVGAGMVQLLALEVDLGPTQMLGHPLRVVERARAADVVGGEGGHVRMEGRIGPGLVVGPFQLEDVGHQGLGDEAAAELAEMPVLVGSGAEGIGLSLS